MKLAVVVDCEPHFQPAARYVVGAMLGMTGLPFGFAAPAAANDSDVVLYYGPAGAAPPGADVAVPAGAPRPARQDLPVETTPDGVRICADPIAASFAMLTDFVPEDEPHDAPLVNAYAWQLAGLLVDAAKRKGLPALQLWPWPDGREHAVVLSHDVDQAELDRPANGLRLLALTLTTREFRGLPRGLLHLGRGLWRALLRRGADPAWRFEQIMELEERAGFRSSFYFVPMATSAGRDPAYDVSAPRMRDLVARLSAGGWEVGVHGSYRSTGDERQLRRERERLEAILGAPVAGIRQHYLRLRPGAFRAQSAAGYVYDSTVGYADAVGFRAGIACPFHPYELDKAKPLTLLEIPLTAMDGALFWHLACSPDGAVERTTALLRASRRQHGLTALLWHQRAGDARRYPGWWEAYEAILERLQQDRRAWVAPAADVARWWLAREQVQMDPSPAGDACAQWLGHVKEPIAGLTLCVWPGQGRTVSVRAAEAAIEPGDDGHTWVRLGPLSGGRHFEVTVQ